MFTKEEFINANKGEKISHLDYLHALFKLEALPFDVVYSIKQLFSPKFHLIEEHVFLSEFFKQEVFDNYLTSKKSVSDIQFWMNLIEITGIFEDMSVCNAKELADGIVHLWNLQLIERFGNNIELARVIHDSYTDEVFIVIGKTPNK